MTASTHLFSSELPHDSALARRGQRQHLTSAISIAPTDTISAAAACTLRITPRLSSKLPILVKHDGAFARHPAAARQRVRVRCVFFFSRHALSRDGEL